jgi:hypothetical protein
MKCQDCDEEFNRVSVLIAHYRHAHTDYDKIFSKWYKIYRNEKLRHLEAQIEAKKAARGEIQSIIDEKCGRRD